MWPEAPQAPGPRTNCIWLDTALQLNRGAAIKWFARYEMLMSLPDWDRGRTGSMTKTEGEHVIFHFLTLLFCLSVNYVN